MFRAFASRDSPGGDETQQAVPVGNAGRLPFPEAEPAIAQDMEQRVVFWANGRQIQKSSGSTKRQDAVRLRDQLLGKKARGEMGPAAADKVTCGELLDDLLEHAKHNVKASTEKIWKLVVAASLRPFFGHRKAATMSAAILKEYRRKRVAEGRREATCNRDLSMLRTPSTSAANAHRPRFGSSPTSRWLPRRTPARASSRTTSTNCSGTLCRTTCGRCLSPATSLASASGSCSRSAGTRSTGSRALSL